MHNVVDGNTQALPGYLVLSNTLYSAGRLSFPKPPHRTRSYAASSTFTDGIPSLVPGNAVFNDPFRDPSTTLFFLFRQKGLFTGPVPAVITVYC